MAREAAPLSCRDRPCRAVRRGAHAPARFLIPHSYIGIQPVKSGGRADYPDRAVGIHHIALWARSRKEVDAFHRDFLVAP